MDTNDTHKFVLMEAYQNLLNGSMAGSDIKIRLISKERAETCFRRDLLTFHSKEMREVIVSLSRTISGASDSDLVIHLPDFSVLTLTKLRTLLETGSEPGPTSDGDIQELREAAACLGVQLKLQQERGKAPAPVIFSTVSVKEENIFQDETGGADLQYSEETRETSESDLPAVPEVASQSQFNCRKCNKSNKSMSFLMSHYILKHYKKELGKWIQGNRCLECNKTFDNRRRLLLHVGIEHQKFEDIMARDDLSILYWNGEDGVEGPTAPPTKPSFEKRSPQKITQPSVCSPTASVCGPALALTMDPPSIPSTSAAEDENPTLDLGVEPPASSARRTGTSCNYSQVCELADCRFKAKNDMLLEEHMCVRHFSEELQAKAEPFITADLSCQKCGGAFKIKKKLILHLGCKHGLINEVLKEKNLMVLPLSVNTKYSAAKQKQLWQIKIERVELEADGSHEDIRKKLLMDAEEEK